MQIIPTNFMDTKLRKWAKRKRDQVKRLACFVVVVLPFCPTIDSVLDALFLFSSRLLQCADCVPIYVFSIHWAYFRQTMLSEMYTHHYTHAMVTTVVCRYNISLARKLFGPFFVSTFCQFIAHGFFSYQLLDERTGPVSTISRKHSKTTIYKPNLNAKIYNKFECRRKLTWIREKSFFLKKNNP